MGFTDITSAREGVKPGNYDPPAIQVGDSYGPLTITIPDLTEVGGPSTIDGATVTSKFYPLEPANPIEATDVPLSASIGVDGQIVTVSLPANASDGRPTQEYYWSLRVETDSWEGTILEGSTILRGTDR